MLQRLIIVRHGAYFGNGTESCELTPAGERQIKALYQRLTPYLLGVVTILSSTFRRNRQSASLFAEERGLPIEPTQLLVSGGGVKTKNEDLLIRVREYAVSVHTLVLITHKEYCDEFPDYFGKHELDMTFPEEESLTYGESFVIDCEQKTCVRI